MSSMQRLSYARLDAARETGPPFPAADHHVPITGRSRARCRPYRLRLRRRLTRRSQNGPKRLRRAGGGRNVTNMIGLVLADDHRVFAEGLGVMLDAQDDLAVLGVAHDSHQAIELAARYEPTVLLLDSHMPGPDLATTLRAIRASSPDTKVLMLSADTRRETIASALEAGVDGFLAKDASSRQITGAIRTLVEGKGTVVAAAEPAPPTNSNPRPSPEAQIKNLKRAAEGGDVEAMLRLGGLLEQLGDLAEARRWLERAAQVGHVEVVLRLGEVLERQGDLTGAVRWLRMAGERGRAGAETGPGPPPPDSRTEGPTPSLLREQVEWVSDSPALRDLLRRQPLARALATRLRRLHEDEPHTSFLVHNDGQWGAGKSTLLNFLRADLEEDWLIVGFDAWRQSSIGPAWWTLLAALRHDLARSLPWWGSPPAATCGDMGAGTARGRSIFARRVPAACCCCRCISAAPPSSA